MINAEELTVEDVTPAVLEEGVRFTSHRSWHGKFGYDEDQVDHTFDVLAEAWALLTRERDHWRTVAMASNPDAGKVATPHGGPATDDPGVVASSDVDEVGMLTFTEHRAVEVCVELWGLLNQLTGNGRVRQGDLAELVVPVHQLQNAILAQAAARAYPRLYRLLGSSVGEQPFDGDVDD